MRRKWFIMILLSCLAMGTIDAKAQDYRRKHESREQRMLRLSDEKFAILYNKVKSTSFDDRKMDLIEVASLGAFYSCEQCALIMGVFSFGDKQLAALRLMAPRIVDPPSRLSDIRKTHFPERERRGSENHRWMRDAEILNEKQESPNRHLMTLTFQ